MRVKYSNFLDLGRCALAIDAWPSERNTRLENCSSTVTVRGSGSAAKRMPLIHHVITGNGQPPIVLVHGFACAHSDWDAQVAHLSPRHQTVTADLRGHGASPGTADESSI